LFLEHNADFNNVETLEMSPAGRDLPHIASEITSGRKMDENSGVRKRLAPRPLGLQK
jgi:hypothetical protein